MDKNLFKYMDNKKDIKFKKEVTKEEVLLKVIADLILNFVEYFPNDYWRAVGNGEVNFWINHRYNAPGQKIITWYPDKNDSTTYVRLYESL